MTHFQPNVFRIDIGDTLLDNDAIQQDPKDDREQADLPRPPLTPPIPASSLESTQ
jgi:hypothetical protein